MNNLVVWTEFVYKTVTFIQVCFFSAFWTFCLSLVRHYFGFWCCIVNEQKTWLLAHFGLWITGFFFYSFFNNASAEVLTLFPVSFASVQCTFFCFYCEKLGSARNNTHFSEWMSENEHNACSVTLNIWKIQQCVFLLSKIISMCRGTLMSFYKYWFFNGNITTFS